jgi:AraC-like DNA-binding protein
MYRLCLLCQGQANLVLNHLAYPAPAGSLIWTSPALAQSYQAVGRVEVIFCLFSPPVVQEVWRSLDPQGEPPSATILTAPRLLEQTLWRLLWEASHPAAATPELLILLWRLALLDFLRSCVLAQQGTAQPPYPADLLCEATRCSAPIAQALHLLRTQYTHEQVTPKWVAQQVGLSLFHFTRRFKQETGLAPGQFLRQQRLHEALHLLRETRLPYEEIAQRCGLGSARHLVDLCVTTFGQRPAALRRVEHESMLSGLRAPAKTRGE